MLKYYIKKDNIILATSLEDNCNKCLRNSVLSKKIIKLKCPLSSSKAKCGCLFSPTDNKDKVFLCSQDSNDINSNRRFNDKLHAYSSMLKNYEKMHSAISEEVNRKTTRLVHNLVSVNAHSIQEIFNFIPQDTLTKNLNHQIKEIKQCLIASPKEAANLILRLAKNNQAMKTEFNVFKSSNTNNHKLSMRSHVIKNVLLNTLHCFFPDFTDSNVYVNVDLTNKKIKVDYETFSVAIYDLIDNAAKYIMPNSNLKIFSQKQKEKFLIIFEMYSFPITNEEIEKICTEGYSGEYPRSLNQSGDGIGMFRTKRLLELNGAEIIIKNNIDPQKEMLNNGFKYEKNHFIISLNE
jgi:K+-sensing histidine kinase KdpD